MADPTTKQGLGILGIGVAACAGCCAGPVIAFVAAASIGTLIGVALFGVLDLAVAVAAIVVYLRRRSHGRTDSASPPVPVVLGRKPDA
jgi:hypothetical protein